MAGRTARATWALLLALAPAVAQSSAGFESWLQGLTIPVPSGVLFELPIGPMMLTGGECRNLTLGSLGPIDHSVLMQLDLGIEIHGLGVSCSIEGQQNGSLTIDLTIVNSSFQMAASIQPFFPEATPNLPLPLGPIALAPDGCVVDLKVSHVKFSGNSSAVGMVSGLPDQELARIMGQFMQEPVCSALRKFVDDSGSAAFAQGQELLAPLLLPPQALPEPEALVPVLDWASYPPLMVVQDLIGTQFPIWAGRYLTVLNVPMDAVIAGSKDVSLSVKKLTVQGRAPHARPGLQILANGPSLGLLANLTSLQFLPTLGINVTLPNQPELVQEIDLEFGLDMLRMGGQLFVGKRKMDALEERGSLAHLSCILDCAHGTTDPANGSIAVSTMEVDLAPGTHIEVDRSDFLAYDGTLVVNAVIAALQAGYLDSITALTNGGLGMARNLMNEMLSSGAFFDWPACGAPPRGHRVTEAAITALWSLAVAFLCVGLLAGFAAPLVCRRTRRKKSPDSDSASDSDDSSWSDDEEIGTRDSEESSEADEDAAAVGARDQALSSEPNVGLGMESSVPVWLRVFYPAALVAIGFLFLYADLSLGALVNIRMIAGQEEEVLGPLFAFSLVNTIEHAWSAGSYLISVLTLAMSGIWPFAKLTLLLIAWLVPRRSLGVERRGRMLAILDVCGKYSFLDSWFLVLSTSAFSLQWAGQSTKMKVEVEPMAPFYAFVTATSLSLVLGHVASEFHRHGLRKQKRDVLASSQENSGQMQSTQRWTSLCSHASGRSRWLVSLMLLVTFAVAWLACFRTSFGFEMGGLAAQVLDVKNKKYSLLHAGTSVTEAGAGEGLVSLEILFLLLTMVLPLLLLLLLLALWLVPMPRRAQELLSYTCHVMDCWSSMDVAALTLTIEAMELGHLTEFLVNSNGLAKPCQFIKDLTRSECFAVGIQMYDGFVILLIAGVAMVVVPKVAHHVCAKAIEAKGARERMGQSSMASAGSSNTEAAEALQ